MIAMLASTFTGRGRGEPALTSFTTIDVPGSTATQAFGINESGQIVGTYVAGPIGHSFLLSEGIFTTIEVPGATGTTATGINDSGQIVGFYEDPTGITHGFLLSQGIFTTIDAPHLSTLTIASGINDRGQIVGTYFPGPRLSFLLSQGIFTTIQVPGAPSKIGRAHV